MAITDELHVRHSKIVLNIRILQAELNNVLQQMQEQQNKEKPIDNKVEKEE